jgi:hypothetical protein
MSFSGDISTNNQFIDSVPLKYFGSSTVNTPSQIVLPLKISKL